MRYKGHMTFFLRKGWLSKGMKAVSENPYIFMPSNSKIAMDELGLGSVQVVALRYWLVAMGLIVKSKNGRCHEPTPLMELIFEKDRYVEEMGTLWALHYNLATNKEEATSWYWLFNEYKPRTFSKEDLVFGIAKFDSLNNVDSAGDPKAIKSSSFEDDVACIFRTYVSNARLAGKETSPENVIDCPLGELAIMDADQANSLGSKKKQYRKCSANQSLLPSELVLYAIASQINATAAERGSGNEISIDELLNGKLSPGRIFVLDSITLLEKLYELEDGGYLRINRTAGSDVVRIDTESLRAIDALSSYYERIN